MKNIAIFCSGQAVDGVYLDAAKETGTLVGNRGFNLIWGAMNRGLMKQVADSVELSGGRLVGITIPSIKEIARDGLDTRIDVGSVHERKEKFLELSDAFITLVGGIGTLDEIMEITELKKHRIHDKPIVIINTNHFFDQLIGQMRRMNREKFFPRPLTELIYFAQTPAEAFTYLDAVFQSTS